ncbi:MAG: hypothetical protein ACXVAY_15585 [Mucilaginibacter sp.]
MKLKFIIPFLALVNCKKENDAQRMVHNGQIVSVKNQIGPMIQGPYRVDSISADSHTDYNMNFYWVTSNNGVALDMPGDDMVDCNTCNYTWTGPSQYIPNGNIIIPRITDNK